MKLPRRKFLHLAAGAAALAAASRIARAQAYPTRPVHLIEGFGAGGATDIVARLTGQALSERLGQSFVVENRAGASSNIATEAVVRASPDGYTLLLISISNAINTTMFKLNFNFIRDIAPVASIVRVPYVMEVHPSVPATTVTEFIAYAKANPGKINLASAGIGASTHMAGEMFKMMADVDLFHVPYRGAQVFPDSARRRGAGIFWPAALIDRVYPGRQPARLGGNHDYALANPAGGSCSERNRAGVRGELVGGHRRAEKEGFCGNEKNEKGGQRRAWG